jgi:hypothetical protein
LNSPELNFATLNHATLKHATLNHATLNLATSNLATLNPATRILPPAYSPSWALLALGLNPPRLGVLELQRCPCCLYCHARLNTQAP